MTQRHVILAVEDVLGEAVGKRILGRVGITNRSFFQGTRSTSRPIRWVRHAGHGRWDDTVGAILGLSRKNWNNDSLYDIPPVTLAFAKVLARVVKRIPKLGTIPYQFRFFM